MMVTIVVPIKDVKARGICSRWIPQVRPGVFVGSIPRRSIERTQQVLARQLGVKMYYDVGDDLTIWESSDTQNAKI